MKKEKTGKSRLLRRYVVSLVVFMLVLILVLSTVTASIIRESLMNMWHDFAFTAVGALVNDSFRAMVEYHERGSVEEELLLSTFVEIEVMQVDWNLINCYIAIPEEDGLRYVFGAGELVRDIPAEEWNGLLLNWKEPYREGMEAWLKTIIEAGDSDSRELLIYNDPIYGHMAVAAEAVISASDEMVGVAFVELSLENVDRRIANTARITSGLIIILMSAAIALLYRSNKRRLVQPIHKLSKEALEVKDQLSAGKVYRSDIHTGDEIEELSQSFEQMSCDLRDYISENSRISAERERIATELDMAASIQANQLPNVFPPFPDRTEFDLFASMKPAKEVGGDFYDFFLVDDDHLALVIADVSGKGVPAALLMMTSRTLIKENLSAGLSPAQALARVNVRLLETGRIRQFVTVWLAVVELSTGRGLAANAGHEHPVLKPAGGSYELVTYKHSPPVAATRKTTYRDREFTLMPGDTLFVYTDGVAEAANADEVLFGTDRLLEALNRAPDAAPEAAIENVNEALRGFVGDAEQSDDITMLCLHYCGAGEKPSFPE